MTKMIQSVAVVEKEYMDALYWWAANMGRYLSSKSVRERLDYRDLAESVMHRVLSLNPDYFYGGPYRYFGAFYARLPGVELKRSEEYFSQAIKSHPDYLGTYVLRARFLHTKAGDRDKFKQDLEYVINADPALIPEVMPENLYEQKLAQMLLEQEDLFFK
jgi:tetratricopeptide (TPR) repeat protein